MAWLALGLQSAWLEATQLLLWRVGACPHLGMQAAVCARLLVVGLAQGEAACAPPIHRELLFPIGSAQSSTSLPRLQQPRAPSLLLSSLHEVLGGRDKQRPRSHIIFLPFTLWPSLFFLLLCILIGTDQDRWPRLGWERPCLYSALFWSPGVLCRVGWMRSIRTDSRVPADWSPGYSFPRTWPMVLQLFQVPLFSASSYFSRRPFVEGGAHPVHAQLLCMWGGGGGGRTEMTPAQPPPGRNAPSEAFLPPPSLYHLGLRSAACTSP